MPFPPTKGTANLDPNRAFSPTAYNSCGAGMSGTIGDYARFLQMLLNEGELDGVRVLRAETVRQMKQNALAACRRSAGRAGASRRVGRSSGGCCDRLDSCERTERVPLKANGKRRLAEYDR